MNKSKKITLIISIALVSIVLLIGVTYALNYTQTGTNQQLILGDIYIHYNEVSGLSISDAVPGADYSNYFEFTISGKNTYTKKDIYYDFLLNRGDLPDGKIEENRIPDEYLKFKLVSINSSNQETVLFADETYDSLENQRIYVETIAKNTTYEVNRKYRLYMTIDNSLEIGSTDTAIFTLDEWVNAFASVKVNVTGDFSEKEVFRYSDCFSTFEKTFYKINPNMTEVELGTCEYFFSNAVFQEGDSARSFCQGTGKIIDYQESYLSYSFYDYINSSGAMSDSVKYLENNNIIIKDKTGLEISNYDSSCGSDVVIPSSINGFNVLKINSWAFSEKELTSVIIPNSIISIGKGAFHRNNLTSVEIPDTVTYIGGGAFTSNLFDDDSKFIYARTDNNEDGIAEIDSTTLVSYGGNGGYGVTLTIPNGVVTIGDYAFYWLEDAFHMDYITFPDTLKIIGNRAFDSGISLQIEQNITFPSLEVLGSGAFSSISYGGSVGGTYQNIGENSTLNFPNIKIIGDDSVPAVKNVIIGNKIEKIAERAFNSFTKRPFEENLNYVRSIKISKSCSEIVKIPGTNNYEDDNYYYPWITDENPYYVVDSTESPSVFIYGLNDELCGSYTSYYNY